MIKWPKIKLLLQNTEVKILLENFAYLSLLQVASYIFPLLTVPYLARVIGVEKFGEIAFAGALVAYFQTIVNFGFLYTATRDIAKNRDNIVIVSKIFSSVMWARLILMVISFMILMALILIVPQFRQMRILLMISFCTIPGQLLFPEWLFQGLERMKHISILNVLARIIFTIAVFVFIKKKSDYILQPLFISIGSIIAGLAAMYVILVNYKIKLNKPSFKEIWNTFKGSTDVFINQLFPNIYNNFSTFLLGFWFGAFSNGILDAGSKFIGLTQQIMQVISRTFFPYLSRNIRRHSIYAKCSLWLSICFSVALFFGAAPLIHLFFTNEFNDAIIVLKILSISPIFLALSNIYGTNYMIIQKHEKALRNITIKSSIIGFCLAWPMIYYFNYIGAAIIVVSTRGLLGISIMQKSIQIKKYSLIIIKSQ